MSERRSKHGGGEEATVIAVNPRNEVLSDKTDMIIEPLIGSDLTVYRVDCFDDAESLSDYHERERRVQDENYEPGYLEEWYDDAFIMDRDGLDEVDSQRILSDGSNFEFIGGMFGDIGAVRESLDDVTQDANYVLNRALTFDYIVWPRNVAGYEEDEIESLGTLLDEDEEQTRERLSHYGLDNENVHF